MRLTVHDAIADIAPEAWNLLAGDAYPFLRHEFLLAAEQTGCVSADAGWAPRHLVLERDGRPVGAMPLYQKEHSWGEFVFDWAWARAYEQAGFDYYPKLVSAVPFTPAPSTRLLRADAGDAEGAALLIGAAMQLAQDTGCSSLHLLFPDETEMPLLERAGLLIRKDCQFHWHNRGYSDFEQFLQTFTASKRKKARRDRRRVSEAGIRFRRLKGGEMDLHTWEQVYRLISLTFMRRGSLPYYNLDFFMRIGASLPDNLLVIVAELHAEPVAAAVFYESPVALYGRYWGSDGHHNALHFETCYYQGIDYCIEQGLNLFEPGAQGEHKISRGFLPTFTWSAHWIEDARFRDAIRRYLDAEHAWMLEYSNDLQKTSPFRQV